MFAEESESFLISRASLGGNLSSKIYQAIEPLFINPSLSENLDEVNFYKIWNQDNSSTDESICSHMAALPGSQLILL